MNNILIALAWAVAIAGIAVAGVTGLIPRNIADTLVITVPMLVAVFSVYDLRGQPRCTAQEG